MGEGSTAPSHPAWRTAAVTKAMATMVKNIMFNACRVLNQPATWRGSESNMGDFENLIIRTPVLIPVPVVRTFCSFRYYMYFDLIVSSLAAIGKIKVKLTLPEQ